MEPLSLARFEDALTGRQPASHAAPRRAAVAVLLRFDDAKVCPEVLLMRRAVFAGDRWSGHVSFPGGSEEPTDPSLPAAAIRETREEVGVDLPTCSRLLGPLDPLAAIAHGRTVGTAIHPFVFLQTAPPRIRLGPEAARSFWLPLEEARSGALDSVHTIEVRGQRVGLPCWNYDGETVWGLTFQMLQALLALAAVGRDR